MVNQLGTAAATTSTTGSSTTSAQAAAAILRYGGLSAAVEKNKEKALEEPIAEEDGQLHRRLYLMLCAPLRVREAAASSWRMS